MRQLLGIQTASARRVSINGRTVMTAIGKQTVIGSVAAQALGLVTGSRRLGIPEMFAAKMAKHMR